MGIDNAQVPLLVRRFLGHKIAVPDLEAGAEVLVVPDAFIKRRQVPVNAVHERRIDLRFQKMLPELSGAVRRLERLECKTTA